MHVARALAPLVALYLILLLALTACAPGTAAEVATPTSAAQESAEVPYEDLDSATFDQPTRIDNEWYPLTPGMQYIYEGTTTEGDESIAHRLEFTVTDLVKEIGGVDTVITWILDYSDGELVEKEVSFYAQDNEGNIWYLGEHPEEYENGEFVTAPTWIHGIQDARAGIAMTAAPQPGEDTYSQGWGPAVDFKDRGRVSEMAAGETCVPAGCFDEVLIVEEFTLAEPDAIHLKYYARGAGHIRVGWRGDDTQQEELQLVESAMLSPEALAEVRAAALELEQHANEISPDVYGLTAPARQAAAGQ